jgi:hypothetical protein
LNPNDVPYDRDNNSGKANMKTLIMRILVALTGLASFFGTASLWFNTDKSAESIGLAAASLAGRATVRADIGGIFAGIGLMCLIAAWRTSRTAATGALMLVFCTVSGRLITVMLDGTGPMTWPPIFVEITTITVLVAALVTFKTPDNTTPEKAPEGL